MKKKSEAVEKLTLTDRFISMIASLCFSVPTAIFTWLAINVEAALWGGGFLSATYLWAAIAIFAALGFFVPELLPVMLGRLWKAGKWWSW